ncbi:MAG: ADP-ribosylglycohydrolase family protein [Chloroflexota bacterium]
MGIEAIRLQRARVALDGLSVGDALGAFLELRHWTDADMPEMLRTRTVPDGKWRFTDDTNMALSIFATLRRLKTIEQDALAIHFARHFELERGYGAGATELLSRIRAGEHWKNVAPNIFRGGSYGNGGAMRVAPLGAYFADDMKALVKNARLSSAITHAHPEGIAGTIAIAVATAVAWRYVGERTPKRSAFIDRILPQVPDSAVKAGIEKARDLPAMPIQEVANILGNGSQVSAQDTVPFAVYCAGEYLGDYEEAIWQTMAGGGDVDTTCAMVGGIVVTYVGHKYIPEAWLDAREALPEWAFSH